MNDRERILRSYSLKRYEVPGVKCVRLWYEIQRRHWFAAQPKPKTEAEAIKLWQRWHTHAAEILADEAKERFEC